MFHFSCVNVKGGELLLLSKKLPNSCPKWLNILNYGACMYRRVPAVLNTHQHLCVLFLSISCHNFIFNYSSVTKLCPTLWDHVDCGTPSSSVLHCLLEFAQICVHWVGDAMIKNSKYTQKRTTNPYVIITHQLCHNFSSFLSTPLFFVSEDVCWRILRQISDALSFQP